ncbi:MAG TPA: TrkH family potassium uptake protein [Vicinamibacterales bacterium]|nr:Trk family potassium uptake protein [Acidobacteriota bacterium]HOC19575.1 TrkH family potassium uptake protein [Vicinamibacterales bacterium]
MAIARRRLSPAQLLTVSVVALIVTGTVLLALPAAGGRGRVALIDAAFTSTSAVCVTGLNVLDTPRDLSLFGQFVLMALIQLGGLGYMTLTTVVAVAIGRQLTVKERLTLHEALNTETMEGLGRFALSVLKLTLAFELTGAALLALRWLHDLGAARAAYYGLFHAVSAFNNAGFALFSDNLVRFRGDWLVNLVVCGLIVCGGLGFVVLRELGHARGLRRLSVHTRLVIGLTALLIVGATAALFFLEGRNPATLAQLPLHERLLASFFQAVTPRTAGFNTIDIGAMAPASLFLLMILMFIGASPGGTGGGVKVTTFGITVAALVATVRGRADTTLFRRRVAPEIVTRAFFISLIAFLALNTIAGLLLVFEGRQLLPTLFETTSAFGTVGLSMGEGGPLSLAGHFSAPGKLLLMAMMLAGRVGPLTLAVALAGGGTPPRVRYPEGRVLIG